MAVAPDAWDYSASDIPSPITDEMEAAQQSKKVRTGGGVGKDSVWLCGLLCLRSVDFTSGAGRWC